MYKNNKIVTGSSIASKASISSSNVKKYIQNVKVNFKVTKARNLKG